MTRLPGILRALLLLLLAAALLLPSFWRASPAAGRAVRIRSAADLGRADSLLAGSPPAALTYESNRPPTAAELETLSAAAERAPLLVAAPGNVRLVEAAATARPLAGRAAAVSFRLRGRPGDSARVYLSDAAANVDSIAVAADARGEADGAFRVRPAAPGWREWRVTARWTREDSAVAAAGAWVDSAGPPRVLVRAGFPDWEAKFVARALEESGATVASSLPLGRGLAVAEGAGGAITPARLAQLDAVVVLDGAQLAPAEAAALAEWASRGGGVLLAGDRAGAAGFGLVRGGERAVSVEGTTIRWALPPELAPLPSDRVGGDAQPFGAPSAGTTLAASSPAGGVLALRPLGRGRAAALALTETWRWRMEAGRIAEHREFWRSLVDWLASSRPEPLSIHIADATGPVAVRREVRSYDSRGELTAAVPPLLIARPGGAVDTLRLARDGSSPGVFRASFVPAAEGLHTLAFAGEPPSAAFRASATAPSFADAWARLSMLASRSGGRVLSADSIGAAVDHLTVGGPSERRAPGAALIFGLLLALGAAEWAIRRLNGRA
ncbi:MAG TPA: hypothetical protein VGO40_19090 [Longimicrobium sp.]|nr:hypothetical protein [Longimicrobium sp.]